MFKRFLTIHEVCGLLDEVSNDEEGELVILPTDSEGNITDEERDDDDLTERHVIEDVAGKVEVFHPSLDNSEQEEVTERNPRPAKRRKSVKVSWEKMASLLRHCPLVLHDR